MVHLKDLIFENVGTIFSSIFLFPVVKIKSILKSVFIQPDIISSTLKVREENLEQLSNFPKID